MGAEKYFNPIIKEELVVPDITPLTDLEQMQPGAAVYRFANGRIFGQFVDTLLPAGDVVLRASYKPQHSHFRGREDGERKCKILQSSKPIIAFDDHDEDWELAGKNTR